VYAFPDSLALDYKYGSEWFAVIHQHMADPLWQTPHKLCVDCDDGGIQVSICGWVEASDCPADTCLEDCDVGQTQELIGSKFYPQRPWVEARVAVPPGAPALPAGIFINVLSLTELAQATPPDGLLMYPPYPLGYQTGENLQPKTPTTVWTIYTDQRRCVCGGGTWAELYELNGVQCL
jgi:hypothetical protein